MSSRGGRHAASVAAMALAGFLAGCGADIAPGPSATPTDVPLPTPVTTTYAVQASVWYAGLIVHVDAASAVLRAGVGAVTVQLRIENPGGGLATLDAPLRLTSGGQVVEPVRGTTLPDVAAGGSAAASVEFDVDAGFDMGLAVLRIGRTAYHQAIVPISGAGVAAVTLKPLVQKVTGKSQAGSLLVTLHGTELRADLPDWGIELPPATMALTVTYDARYAGTFSGGFAFTTANVNLILPNGARIAARADGQSAPAVLIGPGKTVAGLWSRFEVPSPGPGAYALEIRDGSSIKRIRFTVAGA